MTRVVLLVSIAVVLWMGAGLARRRLDVATASRSRRPAAIETARNSLLESLDDPFLSMRSRQLLGALLLADRSNLDYEIREVYAYLGIAHFLALSGLHLGIIALAVSRSLSIIPLPRSLREFMLLAVLGAYAALAGFPPSLVRALALAAALIVSRAIGVKLDLFGSLVLGGCAVSLCDISMIMSSGFQLSFTAVSAIALVALPIMKRLEPLLPQGLPGRIARFTLLSVVITISIQFFSLPLTLRMFGRIPLFAPVINLVFILPVTVLLYLGIPYLIIQFESVRSVLAVPVNFIVDLLWDVPLALSHRPHPAILAGDADPLLFAAGTALAARALQRHCSRRTLWVIAALACLCTSIHQGASRSPVGEGSSTAGLRIGTSTLYGGGEPTLVLRKSISRAQARSIVRALWARGTGSLEHLVVVMGTAGGGDGLLYMLERIYITEILCSPYLPASSREALAAAAGLGIAVREVSAPARIQAGSYVIEIQGPVFPPPRGGAVSPRETDLQVRVVPTSPTLDLR